MASASPNQPVKRGSVTVIPCGVNWHGRSAAKKLRLVAEADAVGHLTRQGRAADELLSRYAPCVILIDELVAYVRQFEEGKALTGGTYDSNLSFVQALTEAMKAVPTAVLLASLPESDKEAGSQRGVKALAALSHYFGRVQALWKPVAPRRLSRSFAAACSPPCGDEKLAAEAVCRAFADFYIAEQGDLPGETQESRYFERLLHAYPIHPEVFDRLYEDWSTLDNFQRTRGVLKLMAKVISPAVEGRTTTTC
jgi:predicted AAA+ superfamily ATPase